MLKAIALESANDASLAIAEHLAGSEQAFIDMMNKRASQLGMKHSKFANPHGLPVDDEMNHHYSSAADIAIMSRELLKHKKILEYTGLSYYRLMQNNGRPFEMSNSNKMLGAYEGMDGLKTGFTYTAKQCLVATAKRDGMRLIAVVLGEPDKLTRAAEISAMLDYGFANYAVRTFIEDGEELGVVKIYKGIDGSIRYHAQNSYAVVMKKTDNVQQYSHKVKLSSSIKAPVSVGDQVGEVLIYKDKKVIERYPLYIDVSIKKMSFMELLGDVFRRALFANP
jgi:D-alanyl-D-alanine carboxypeptidase (penicillin-binding protein 5/6)